MAIQPLYTGNFKLDEQKPIGSFELLKRRPEGATSERISQTRVPRTKERVHHFPFHNHYILLREYSIKQGFPDRGPRAQIWAPDRLFLGPLGLKYMH